MTQLSGVTPTKDSEQYIRRVVKNVLEIADESVVVVDPRSRNIRAIIDAVESAGGRATLGPDQEFNYSDSRNTGNDATTGEWVIQIDQNE